MLHIYCVLVLTIARLCLEYLRYIYYKIGFVTQQVLCITGVARMFEEFGP